MSELTLSPEVREKLLQIGGMPADGYDAAASNFVKAIVGDADNVYDIDFSGVYAAMKSDDPIILLGLGRALLWIDKEADESVNTLYARISMIDDQEMMIKLNAMLIATATTNPTLAEDILKALKQRNDQVGFFREEANAIATALTRLAEAAPDTAGNILEFQEYLCNNWDIELDEVPDTAETANGAADPDAEGAD